MDHHEVGLQHHHCTQTAAEWHLMRAGGETLLTLQMASETSGWCPCSRQGVSPSPVSLTRTISAELGVVCCLGLAEHGEKGEEKGCSNSENVIAWLGNTAHKSHMPHVPHPLHHNSAILCSALKYHRELSGVCYPRGSDVPLKNSSLLRLMSEAFCVLHQHRRELQEGLVPAGSTAGRPGTAAPRQHPWAEPPLSPSTLAGSLTSV